MKCPRCEHENPSKAKFCLECGVHLALTCAQCGAELPADAKFCLQCGRQVSAPSAEQSRFTSPEAYTPKHLAEKILTSKSALAKGPSDKPGSTEQVELYACKDRRELMEPYDRLLGDAMEGPSLLFSRQDEVEAAWRIVDPVLRDPPPVHEYEPGTWGPRQADELVASHGGWHNPKVT